MGRVLRAITLNAVACSLGVHLHFSSCPAAAQTAQEDTGFIDEIIISATQKREIAFGQIEPELTLDEEAIASYGVVDLQELLEEIELQTSSNSGRSANGEPVVLLDGVRISGFREIRRYPSGAVLRVEVLPEDAALAYGFRADQRVINIILKDNFRALTTDLAGTFATEGGQVNGEGAGSHLLIRNGIRLSTDLRYVRDTALLESERDVADSRTSNADIIGNVVSPIPGGEIDPLLSALAGETITIAGAPTSAASSPISLQDLSAGDANETDTTAFRTLLPQQDTVSFTSTYSGFQIGSATGTATGSIDYTKRSDDLGLASANFIFPAASPLSPFSTDVLVARLINAGGPLQRTTSQWDGNLTLVLNDHRPTPFSWTALAQYTRTEVETKTDTGLNVSPLEDAILAGTENPFSSFDTVQLETLREKARTKTNKGILTGTAFGKIGQLPAGPVSTSVTVGGEFTRLRSINETGGVASQTRLSRDQANIQTNFFLPIFRRGYTRTPIGDVTLSGNARFDYLSDFGSLRTYGYSLIWRPANAMQITASVTQEDGPPTIQQLGDPVVVTPNVRVFDFETGETVEDVVRTTGGAPDLLNDNRRILRVNVSYQPFEERRIRLTAAYTDQKFENAISDFPSLTPDIQSAFPERFIRDAQGNLLAIDARPINFAETKRRDFRYGLNWSMKLNARKKTPTTSQRKSRPNKEASGDQQSKRRPGRRGRGNNIRLSVFHTVVLSDSVLLSDGGERLNLLAGDAIATSGGTSRHLVEGRLGLSYKSFTGRLRWNWRSGTSIKDGGSGDLFFSDLATVDIRLSFHPDRSPKLLAKHPIAKDTRLSVYVNNLFNDRQKVTDETGVTPIGFQPELIDPLGRTVRFRINKAF